MRRLLYASTIAWLALILVPASLAYQGATGSAEGPDAVGLGTDMTPDGNSSTTLGGTDGCISVATGETFDFDIYVTDVEKLIHWELYLTYDPSIVEMVDANLRMFLAENPWSSVKTESVLISNGQYFLGAADTRDASESGSGVLARLTMEAKGPGISETTILYDDVDGDGAYDKGPRLTSFGGVAVGDVTGDGVFDGPTSNAYIAVDESCASLTPTPILPPSPTPPSSGDTTGGVTAAGDGVDNDGDTLIDEDPPDGVDNDGDASIDEDGGEAEGLSTEGSSGAVAADGSGGEDGDTEDASAAVLRADGGPSDAGDSGQGGASLGADSPPSSSSGGGFPLWAIIVVAVGLVVGAGGTSIFVIARSGGRYWR